ncbi:MAG TPA: murein biosynthesis integral membrane protein MurJ [Caulobacteraceae bacterium]|nr:murein biosynthesis integral membrane protein MurJ [Caulobacteraceae bacterium]
MTTTESPIDGPLAAEPPAPPKPVSDEPDARRSAGVVGIAVMGSRVFGLGRELVFTSMFGAGKVLDAYYGAFQIPNLLRDLFAEGSLSTAFTALFARTWDREGDEPAWKLANLTLSAMIFIIGLVSIVAIAAAPLIVEATNFGFHNVPGKFELTVSLTRVMFPFILFVSLAAAVMGMLNARFIFGVPASASTVFNIVSVIAGVGLAFLFDEKARATWPHPVFGVASAYGVSLGVLLGGVAQLGMQLPALFKLGFRFRWRLELGNPRLRELWALMWPSVIAGAAVQVNVVVNGMFASEFDGGRSWLNCAFRLMQFPIGLFGVSLATVTLPAVARRFARDDMGAFGRTVRSSMRLTLFLSVPAAVGLAALARPIIGLIYQHGHFSARDTNETALVLQAYALGLAGYAAIKVLTPCFYALNLPRTPLRISLIAIGVNLALNLANANFLGFGVAGLAVATSCVALANFGQLCAALSRQVDFGGLGEWAGFLLRIGLAAAACGAAAWGVYHLAETRLPAGTLRVLALMAAIGIAVAIYAAVAFALRIRETTEFIAVVSRRLSRRRARAA